jgi:hypothetical protein
MTDLRIAPLAAALHRCGVGCADDIETPQAADFIYHRAAAADILSVLPPDWCGHDPITSHRECVESIAALRLATIELAAREVAEAWHDYEEAHAGRHDGPHKPEWLLDGDCGVCASAQYGTEVTMNEYVVPALRAALADR